MRVRALLAAAVLAVTVAPPAAQAGEIITIDGVQYEIIASGTVPVERTAAISSPLDRLGLESTGPSCRPSITQVEVTSFSWHVLWNLTTEQIHYHWMADGFVRSGRCATDVRIRIQIVDLQVLGTSTQRVVPGVANVQTAPADPATRIGSVSASATNTVLYYAYSTAAFSTRSEVIGTVTATVEGEYRDYLTGEWQKVGCAGYQIVFTPTPQRPLVWTSGSYVC